MAKQRYLISTKKPGLEFRVLAVQPLESGGVRATLLGAHGVQFAKVLTDELLAKYGYTLQVREVPDGGGAAV